MRLREMYPARDRGRLEDKVSDAFVDRLIAEVTRGFRGDVGVVPRQFLREFVNQMDLVDEHADYEPMRDYAFSPQQLRAEEQAAMGGQAVALDLNSEEGGGGKVPVEDVW